MAGMPLIWASPTTRPKLSSQTLGTSIMRVRA
jgi:hypothetical protein